MSPAAPPPPATSTVVAPVAEPSPLDYVAHPERDDAVAREYGTIDEQLQRDFDFDSGKLRFAWVTRTTGYPPTEFPTTAVRAAFDTADQRASSLARLVARQPSPKWVVTALARAASIYESLWLALKEMQNALTPTEQAALHQKGGHPNAADMLDEVSDRPRRGWMDTAARKAVGGYAWALAFARATSVAAPQDDLRTRLTVFRHLLGDRLFESMVTSASPPRGVARESVWLTLRQLGDL